MRTRVVALMVVASMVLILPPGAAGDGRVEMLAVNITTPGCAVEGYSIYVSGTFSLVRGAWEAGQHRSSSKVVWSFDYYTGGEVRTFASYVGISPGIRSLQVIDEEPGRVTVTHFGVCTDLVFDAGTEPFNLVASIPNGR